MTRINEVQAKKISDVIRSVSLIPEFRHSMVKPHVRTGGRDNYLGKFALVIPAGTNGGYGIAKACYIQNSS